MDEKVEGFYQIRAKEIVDMLNKTNPKFKISDHRDVTITQYLLWRVLAEGKTKQKSPNTRFLDEFRTLFDRR